MRLRRTRRIAAPKAHHVGVAPKRGIWRSDWVRAGRVGQEGFSFWLVCWAPAGLGGLAIEQAVHRIARVPFSVDFVGLGSTDHYAGVCKSRLKSKDPVGPPYIAKGLNSTALNRPVYQK